MSNYGIVEKNIDNVKQWLSEGFSAAKIAKKLGCGKSSVLKKIHEYKLINTFLPSVNPNNLLKNKYELILEKFNNGCSITQIAKNIGHSDCEVWKLLKKNGIDTYKYKCKYTLDETFFEKIDSEEKAWVLGWWMSDGNVMKSGKIRIGLNSIDEEVLIKIANCLKWTGPLQYKKAKENKGQQSILNIDRKKLADDLIKLGCPPKKSLILEFPTSVPEYLYPHFLRGFFEGDGGVSKNRGKYQGAGFTTTDIFAKKLREILEKENIIATNFYYRRKNKPTGSLYFGKKEEVKKLLIYLYKDATLWLERKKKICDEILSCI